MAPRWREDCSKLFFQYTRLRGSQNRIPNLKDDDGYIAQSHSENKVIASKSYERTFTKRIPDEESMQKVLNAINSTNTHLTETEINYISDRLAPQNILNYNPAWGNPPDSDWLLETIKALKMYKAPGPDGLPNEFYYLMQDCNSMIYVLKEVYNDSLRVGFFPESMRETYIRLLYKKGQYSQHKLEEGGYDQDPSADPRKLSNWRPISLICCDSKILSAYIGSWLKEIIDRLVSRSQSAFIPGRSIHETIMLVQQIIHRHNAEDIPGGLLFIDFAHAYDYISQEYIIRVLEEMKFPQSFLNAIKMTMTNLSARVIINGDLSPRFPVDNGGRQGDPLFPLIYVIALEGLTALIKADTLFKGITSPNPEVLVTNAGHADDTVVMLDPENDDHKHIGPILDTFCQASGNEIKKAKSFVMWLSSKSPAQELVYGIEPIPRDKVERYLGLDIAQEGDILENWDKQTRLMPRLTAHWSTMGLTVMGRTLLMNASLLSKLWFIAMLIPANKTVIKKILDQTNRYFRKGKRSNTVKILKRYTPKALGGLGQLDPELQIRNLQAKWVINSLAASPHPWNIYWNHGMEQMVKFCLKDTCVPPEVLDIDWNKVIPHEKVFHLMIPAYKAFADLKLKVDLKHFHQITSMPIFENKYITDSNGKSLILRPDASPLPIYHMLEPVSNLPEGEYNYQNTSTWRVKFKNTADLNSAFDTNASNAEWSTLIGRIPTQIKKVIHKGPEPVWNGWACIQLEDEAIERDEEGNKIGDDFGDIYYVVGDNRNPGTILNLLYFTQRDDHPSLLEFGGTPDESWGDWRQEILPNLSHLRVSVLSGAPTVLGWGDEVIGPSSFHLEAQNKFEHPKSIESLLAPSFYHSQKFDARVIKINFNAASRLLREQEYEPLRELDRWPPTLEEALKCRARGLVPAPDWKKRFKYIHNARHLLPKYRQLIYWITTDSLLDGRRINRTRAPRGVCTACNTLATPEHMFSTCVIAVHIWQIASHLAEGHWADYEPFEYNLIPTLLNSYNPVDIFHLCFLWGLWRHWLDQFLSEDPEDVESDQITYIVEIAQKEFIKRICEIKPMTQWLRMVANRRVAENEGEQAIPEKMFLLRYATMVRTNPKSILLKNETKIDPLILKWTANEHLLMIDYTFHRPRLRINYAPWSLFLPPPLVGAPADPANGWSAIPQHVVNMSG